MNKILLVLSIGTALMAADAVKDPITSELRAKFWKAQFEQKVASDNLESKNAVITAVVTEIKSACKAELELDPTGNIACKKLEVPKPEASKSSKVETPSK